MKQLLLIAVTAIVLTGFTYTPKERFYVFGFSATTQVNTNYVGVFWVSLNSPKFPSITFMKTLVQSNNKGFSNILITSMYEFKSREDYLEAQK